VILQCTRGSAGASAHSVSTDGILLLSDYAMNNMHEIFGNVSAFMSLGVVIDSP
jgi:hypothetical protein